MMKIDKKWLPLLALVVALVGSGGFWWFANGSATTEQHELVKKQKYFKVKKIVLSLPSDRYLLIEFSLKMTEYQEDTSQLIEDFSPVIRNATILVMGRKPIEELIDSSYLKAHQDSIHGHIAQQFADNGIDIVIDDVLITKLVVQ
ncbi:flagellar basal body-associated FliL family protein [Ferrimonas lipolytica]|uniref:Flagellar protein FliL n=1 Tax=Ferrimonas lipolytica TaxID=2724191 RepID=A0A6H1UCG7_9GAMM|nr:flagellar basal body-associated FliL family protein [Ferrimonas lipolytica]QIZ76797.1 hypothetical protein HER31_07855 [Ferrimonas lipolytica]